MDRCSVAGCTNKAKYVKTGWCQKHYHRWWRHGDPHYVKHPREGTGPIAWKKEKPKYRAVHVRVAVSRGKASEYTCEGCGGQAEQWAYDGTDPSPQMETIGNRTVPFSYDLERYAPLCIGCHVRLDRYESITIRKVPNHE